MKYELLAFDVNETLLDVSEMSSALEAAVGPGIGLGEWFARMLHRSVVANLIGHYQPFGELGAEALVWLAAREGMMLTPEEAGEVVGEMTRLPPHPDVEAGLERLASEGRRMIALTNGSTEVVAAQLGNSGLDRFFERRISVDAIGRFKPAPEVYLHAAAVCGVDIDRMVLVAAHDWDVAGAQSVGAPGCFVRRQPWGIVQVTPTISVSDMSGLAEALAAGESRHTAGG